MAPTRTIAAIQAEILMATPETADTVAALLAELHTTTRFHILRDAATSLRTMVRVWTRSEDQIQVKNGILRAADELDLMRYPKTEPGETGGTVK